MKKRVRFINTAEANKKMQIAHNYRKVVPQFKKALASFDNLQTIEEIDEYLKSKTGFANHLMSASAMGLEIEYSLLLKYLGKIDLSVYDKQGLVSNEYKAQCIEEFTKYYSDEEVKIFEKIEKMLVKINEMKVPNGAIYSDHKGALHFNEKRYTVAKQLLNSSRGVVQKAE